MQLAPGTRLGSYEIISAIGAGGMGEVYRARDTRLNRDVAIKVLPEAFAADPDRLARFEREAQTLAALNHPNIAHIHGVVDRGLVMELVEGEDLSERLTRGPLPLDEALAIARQIAEALDAAHERGVIHRDLKPANVKITADGTVKVLDFGLAKALDPLTPASASAMNSPTFTSPAVTHMGVILGTAAYMSPEQAKGKPVDRRADIWALGVVLFEMLTGKLLYQGETVTETIAHVITQPANLDSLPPATPASVRRILRRTLEKDPRKRFHSAGDVRIELEEAMTGPEGGLPPEGGSHRKQRGWTLWAAGAALVIVSLVAVLKPFGRESTVETPSMRLDVRIAENAPIIIDDNIDGAVAVLSPDGQTLVYLAQGQPGRRLYVRRLDASESTPLAGTDGALGHFFSPDGKWIAFFAGGQLKKVATDGGTPLTIAPAADPRGGTWGPDDVIVFTPGTTDGLFRVSAAGGTPEPLTTRGEKERTHRWPSFIPGTNIVLFIAQAPDGAYDQGTIEAVRLDSKERKVIVRGGTFPRYLPSGHLLYARESTIFAVPFDPRRLETTGTAHPVLSSVLTSRGVGAGVGDGAAQFAFSDTGTVVFITGGVVGNVSQLVVMDRTGKPVYTHPQKAEFRSPRFSPDGTRIAVQMVDGRAHHLFLIDPARSTTTKLTFDGTLNGTPTWSRDGRLVAYFSDRVPGGLNIFTTQSDGAGEPTAVTNLGTVSIPSSFSPDGAVIAGMQQGEGAASGLDIVTFSVKDGAATPFFTTPASDMLPVFSPDGHWIAYASDTSGVPQVYVRPYPRQAGQWQLSTTSGVGPVWTKKGREVIYVAAAKQVIAVDVSVENGAIRVGKSQTLFETGIAHPPNASWMDASADGSKIVILKRDGAEATVGHTHVTLMTNFFDHVRKTVR